MIPPISLGTKKNKQDLVNAGYLPSAFPWMDTDIVRYRDVYAVGVFLHGSLGGHASLSDDLSLDVFLMDRTDDATLKKMLGELGFYMPERPFQMNDPAEPGDVFDILMSIRTKGSWSTGGIPRSDRLVTTNMLLSYYHMMMFGTTYRDDGYLISTSEVQAVSDSGKLNPNDSVIPPTPFPTILEELGFSAIKPGLSDVLVDAILNSPLLQREHIYNARTEGLNRTAKKCFGRCWAEILGVSYTKSFDQDSGQLLVMQEGTEQTREYIMTFLTTNGVIDPIRKTLNKEKLQQIIRQKLS